MFSRDAFLWGIRWAFLSKALGQIISWVSTIFVIRMLSPHDYGLVALAGIPIGLVAIVSAMGLDEVITRQDVTSEEYKRRALGFLFVSNSFLFIIIMIISPYYASYVKAQELAYIMPVLGIQLIIGAFGLVPSAILERQLKLKEIAYIEISALIVGSICSLSLALVGAGVWALIVATLASQSVRSFGLSKAGETFHRPRFKFDTLLVDMAFAGKVFANKALWYLTQTMDDLLIGTLLGQQVLGNYSVGKNFAMLPLQKISAIVHQVSFPSIAHSKNESHRQELILKGLSLICCVTFPVFFLMATVADPLSDFIFGSKWTQVRQVLIFVSLLMPVKTINNFIGTAVSASGYPGIRLISQLLLLITTIVAITVGFDDGLSGVLYSLLAGHYIIFPLILINYCRALTVSAHQIVINGGRHFVISSIPMAMSFILLDASGYSGWYAFFMKISIFLLMYILLAVLFARQDMRRLKDIFWLKSVSKED